MKYPDIQYIQFALSMALGFLAWVIIRRIGTSWDKAPFVWVITGYGAFSAISNLIRWELFDHTALWVITEDLYLYATLWWCASLIVSVLAYLWMLNQLEKRVSTSVQCQAVVNGVHRASARVPLSHRVRFYIVAGIFLALLYLLNPFGKKDLGILAPKSIDSMAQGGLLIGSFIFNTLAAVAVCLLRYSPMVGLLAVSGVVWQYTGSGSKGLSVMYLLYLATFVWHQRRQKRWRIISLIVTVGLLASIIVVLPIAISARYGGRYFFTEALPILLGRFTQQDAAAVLWASPTWRASFAPLYIKHTLLSFIPGFLFRGKPINPAYEINALYFGGVGIISAASPSLFGAILIVVKEWLYWPTLILIIFIICKLDAFFCRHPLVEDTRFDYGWLYFYTLVVLFEATFVMAFVQLAIVFVWRQFLSKQIKTTSAFKGELNPMLRAL